MSGGRADQQAAVLGLKAAERRDSTDRDEVAVGGVAELEEE